MKEIRALLAVLLLTGILGFSAVPVRAGEGFIDEDIIITDVDPSDDVHGREIVSNERLFGWSYTTHGLAAAFTLLLRELQTATGSILTNLTRSG